MTSFSGKPRSGGNKNPAATPGTGAANLPAPLQHFEIVQGKCKVCNFPHRREIDMLLATGWSQTAVRNHWNQVIENDADKFTPNNMSIHARNHLSSKDAAIRRIIEARARAVGVDVDAVENHITTKAGVLDTIIQSGLTSLHKGETVAETREVIAAIQMLDKMEAEWKETAVDEMMRDFRAFTEAVKEVVGEDLYATIYETFERKLDSDTARLLRPQLPPGHEETVADVIDGEVAEEEDNDA